LARSENAIGKKLRERGLAKDGKTSARKLVEFKYTQDCVWTNLLKVR